MPRPAVRVNLSANLLGTGITAVVSLVSAPLIFRWLGADAYGMVGLYLLLQGLMPLFDLGITPGLARAVASHRGSGSEGQVRTLIGLAESPIRVLSLLFAAGLIALSGPIAHDWVELGQTPAFNVRIVLILMGIALAIRMLASLQRAALMAIEHQVQANAVQSLAAIARTLGALVFALVTGTGVYGFFAVQIPVSAVELVAYRRCLSKVLTQPPMQIEVHELRQHKRFALGIAWLSALWLLTSQVDKLALSRFLPLAEYGAYSLGVHIASAVLIASGPVQAAVLPRLTRLVAAREEGQARLLYGLGTALTVAIVGALTVGILLGASSLIPMVVHAQMRLATNPAQIAIAYALGNSAIAITALAYVLQNARGQLRLHALGALAQVALQVPVLVLVASSADAFATAAAFAGLNWLFLILWMPIVHAKLLKGGHIVWLRRDFFPPFAVSVLAGLICLWLAPGHKLNLYTACLVAGVGAMVTAATTLLAHADMRGYLRQWWLRRAH